MNFLKSNFAKRLIIILVVLMIFNIAIPKEVHAAWDFAGILMKPVTALLVCCLGMIDLEIGAFVQFVSVSTSELGSAWEGLTTAGDPQEYVDAHTIRTGVLFLVDYLYHQIRFLQEM